jgi:thioredoxin-like negative regulator of GroEL
MKRNEKFIQIMISLDGINPLIWRRLMISNSITFYELHKIIQTVMGWTDTHLHEFFVNGINIGQQDEDCPRNTRDEKLITLNDIIGNTKKIEYIYDFGDCWEHTIRLEKILDDYAGKVPFFIEGKRACPPEDCGGVIGYEEVLKLIKNPTHKQNDNLTQWAGYSFDPEKFDIKNINKKLAKIKFSQCKKINNKPQNLSHYKNEFAIGMKEFFDKKEQPGTDEEERTQMQEFVFWYNNVRKQSDTGKTPAEMNERIMQYEEDNAEEEYVLEEAFKALNNANYNEALEMCNWGLEMNPNDENLLSIKIETHLNLGNFKEAQKTLLKLEKINPAYPPLHLFSATISIFEPNLKKALKEINQALKTDPNHFDFIITKAQILFLMDDDNYKNYIDKVKQIDAKRTNDFINNLWIEKEEIINKELQALNNMSFDNNTKDIEKQIQKIRKLKPKKENKLALDLLEIYFYLNTNQIEKAKKKLHNIKDIKNNHHAEFCKAKIAFLENNLKKALGLINPLINDKKIYGELFMLYNLKSQILKIQKDNNYKKWEEKAKIAQEQNLAQIKKEFEESGIKFTKKNGLIKIE